MQDILEKLDTLSDNDLEAVIAHAQELLRQRATKIPLRIEDDRIGARHQHRGDQTSRHPEHSGDSVCQSRQGNTHEHADSSRYKRQHRQRAPDAETRRDSPTSKACNSPAARSHAR